MSAPKRTTKKIAKPSAPAGSPEAPPAPGRAYRPEEGKKALEALAPRLQAIRESELVSMRVDIQAATFMAMGVASFATSEGMYERFRAMPRQEFDIANVDRLQQACFAVLYTLAEARSAKALETEAKLPAGLVAEAVEVEGRMQQLSEYHFSDDPELGPEVSRLRPGKGHRDLAGDLLGYARIYEKRSDLVAKDAKNYRPTDAADAQRLAGQIIAALAHGMTPKARRAYDAYVRSWTLLNTMYDEAMETGLWLLRRDPKKHKRFPALFAAGRSAPSKPRKSKKGEPKDQ